MSKIDGYGTPEERLVLAHDKLNTCNLYLVLAFDGESNTSIFEGSYATDEQILNFFTDCADLLESQMHDFLKTRNIKL